MHERVVGRLMGLDTTHDCWHGSYGSFSVWRNAVAEAGGYPVADRDQGPYLGVGPSYWQNQWDDLPERTIYGEWDDLPEDPLLVLLIHSDCEGVIPAKVAPFLAERLERLAPLMSDDGPWPMRDRTLQFAAGLRKAAEAGEDVEFW